MLFVSSHDYFQNNKEKVMMVLLTLSMSVFGISGCSSASSSTYSKTNKKTAQTSASSKNAVMHIHNSTECLDVITHSHVITEEGHKHSSHCVNNNTVSNAHTHPASKGAGAIRHVHPNGANKHSHTR